MLFGVDIMPTDGVDFVFDARRHDLVPLEDLDYCPTASLVAPDATEGMHEFCGGSKESFNGLLLQ